MHPHLSKFLEFNRQTAQTGINQRKNTMKHFMALWFLMRLKIDKINSNFAQNSNYERPVWRSNPQLF